MIDFIKKYDLGTCYVRFYILHDPDLRLFLMTPLFLMSPTLYCTHYRFFREYPCNNYIIFTYLFTGIISTQMNSIIYNMCVFSQVTITDENTRCGNRKSPVTDRIRHYYSQPFTPTPITIVHRVQYLVLYIYTGTVQYTVITMMSVISRQFTSGTFHCECHDNRICFKH